MFSGQPVPAAGISLGLERILVVMGERNMFPAALATTPADVMVTIWNRDSVPDTLALAAELRSAGLRVEVYPDADKLGKQLKYASSRTIPFVIVVGDDERVSGVVALKNLQTGEQQMVPRAEAAALVRDALRAS
jgi:histidyl-tRNA synthetase